MHTHTHTHAHKQTQITQLQERQQIFITSYVVTDSSGRRRKLGRAGKNDKVFDGLQQRLAGLGAFLAIRVSKSTSKALKGMESKKKKLKKKEKNPDKDFGKKSRTAGYEPAKVAPSLSESHRQQHLSKGGAWNQQTYPLRGI